jgi:hypothetical protein
VPKSRSAKFDGQWHSACRFIRSATTFV